MSKKRTREIEQRKKREKNSLLNKRLHLFICPDWDAKIEKEQKRETVDSIKRKNRLRRKDRKRNKERQFNVNLETKKKGTKIFNFLSNRMTNGQKIQMPFSRKRRVSLTKNEENLLFLFLFAHRLPLPSLHTLSFIAESWVHFPMSFICKKLLFFGRKK